MATTSQPAQGGFLLVDGNGNVSLFCTGDALAGANLPAHALMLWNGSTLDRCYSVAAGPQKTGIIAVGNGASPATALAAGTSTGTGGTIDWGVARANHSLVVTSSAGVSAGVVTFEGSLDASNWFITACTCTTNAANTVFANNLANFPFRYVRAAVTTNIVGGTISALVASC